MPEEQAALDYDAPIIEAVIALDCDLAPGNHALTPEMFCEAGIDKNYTENQQIEVTLRRFQADGSNAEHHTAKTNHGVEFRHRDKRQICRFRTDGFSFHRLEPYTSFDDYFPEISRLWSIYCDTAAPVMLTRVSMRYINRIPVPFERDQQISFAKYLKNVPSTLSDYEMTLGGIFQTLRMSCSATGAEVQLTSATEEACETHVPVVLDIEASLRMKTQPVRLEDLSEKLESLRSLKNKVFRTTLTQACQNQFQS